MASRGSVKRVQQALDALREARDPLAALTAARLVGESTDDLEFSAVVQAREAGVSWTKIGEVYGTSKQGAQQRFKSSSARQHRSGAANSPEAATD